MPEQNATQAQHGSIHVFEAASFLSVMFVAPVDAAVMPSVPLLSANGFPVASVWMPANPQISHARSSTGIAVAFPMFRKETDYII